MKRRVLDLEIVSWLRNINVGVLVVGSCSYISVLEKFAVPKLTLGVSR